jgi:hypothetical protein
MAEELIVADLKILGGKPCVRGTRLSVELLLELAASGATQEQILAQYPQDFIVPATDQPLLVGRPYVAASGPKAWNAQRPCIASS